MSTSESQTYKYMEWANLLHKMNPNSRDDDSDTSLGARYSDPELFLTSNHTSKPVFFETPQSTVFQFIIKLPRID